MVYCGKPSRGCQMCRTRRIKCDETKPSCNRCLKSHRQCPGYKDEFDIVLRNETKAIERRVKRAEKRAETHKAGERGLQPATTAGTTIVTARFSSSASALPSSSAHSSSSSSAAAGSSSSTSGPVHGVPECLCGPGAIIPAIQTAPDTRAACHFVSNFVMTPRPGSTRGFMYYLVPLLADQPPDSHMRHAFNACALSLLSSRASGTAPQFAVSAYSEYSKALSATKAALSHPKTSTSDATLGAVLLMSMFESLTASRSRDYEWGSHAEGAIRIAMSRGREQLRTKTGVLLFAAVRTQVIIHTMITHKPPVNGTEWWVKDAANDEVTTACHRLNLRASELRSEVTRVLATSSRTPDNIDLVLALMRRAQLMDQDVVSWMEELPEAWRYKTICWEDHVPGGDYGRAEVFPGRVDVYGDFLIAGVWNMGRNVRVLLASVAVRCAAWVCSPADYRTTPEYATASRTCSDVITDVLASVPYHLGWHAQRRLVADHHLTGFACGEDDATKSLAGYFLTWPLACILTLDFTTDAQRRWIAGRLRHIGDTQGIRYAYAISHMTTRFPSSLIRRDAAASQSCPASQRPSPSPSATSSQKEHAARAPAEIIAKPPGMSPAGASEVQQRVGK